MAGLATLAGGALAVAGGTAGWRLHRVFGEEPALAAARAGTQDEERALAALREMTEGGKTRFAIPESDGRRLRLLAEAVGAKSIVEVGTSTGYSTLWLGLGARATGGHVTTFEIDEQRAAEAKQNFARAGLDGDITLIAGDAHKNLTKLAGPIDLVFLDADKDGYVDYLNKLLPLVRPGGLILAHNVSAAPDYLHRVTTDPQFDTVRLTEGSGLTVTVRKRQSADPLSGR